ncbi:MAG: three-Cys-motif partner protein TcmP [Anaerolineae bacterium]
MAVPQDTIWEIEQHTLAKHEILRRYLGAWFPILSTGNLRVVYIDGFCGPGKYKGGEDGSPIIALREAIKHSERLKGNTVTFLFVDERSDRIAHLEGELSKFPIPNNFVVRAIPGQFESVLGELLDNLESEGSRLAPTFAFIDPFGFKGVPFDLVQRLLANPKTEVFVNVMIEAVNRFLEHPDAQTRQHIVDLFGTDKVLEAARRSCNRTVALRLLYQRQLSGCARFVRYFEMRDSYNRTIYCLFFASNHRLGHVKMKEAFWKVDTSSGFCFSDATNPDQRLLFEINEVPSLASDLLRKFANQRVSVGEIRQYVEDDTPFIASQMRTALRQLEQDNKIVVGENKIDGSKRRKNTYPDDAVIVFK